jgi:WD domain, G-beta repeat
LSGDTTGGRLKLYDLPDLQLRKEEAQRGLSQASFDPQGLLVAALSNSNVIALRCTERLQPLYEFLGHDQPVSALAFTPSNRYMVSGARDGTARVWPLDAKPAGPDGACLAPGSASTIWSQLRPGGPLPPADLGPGVLGVAVPVGSTFPLRTTASLLEEAQIAAGRKATAEELGKALGEGR